MAKQIPRDSLISKLKKVSSITEDDILSDGEKKKRKYNKSAGKSVKEFESKPEPESELELEDINEEDILRAGKVRNEAKKSKSKADIEERKVPKKEIITSSFVQEFAKTLSCKVATEVLGSDVVYWYSFDCAPLDIVFGGGIPSGKVVECFGWESSGKSTLTLEAAKAFCRHWEVLEEDKYVVLWLESESALDKVRAQYMGCDLSRFVIQEVETIEDGFKTIRHALEKAKEEGLHVFISWDTIAAVLTESEKTTGEFNTKGMGEKARLVRMLLKDVSTLLGQTNSTLFFVNQMYKTFSLYGEKDEVPGGGGIKFHASVRCLMRKVGLPIEVVLPSGNKITKGIEVELYTKKNKLTLPYQTCRLVINGESGLDVVETLSRFLVVHRYITVRGGWKYIEFDDVEYRFQNNDQLREIFEVKCPELKIYMNYLCYTLFAAVSPLLKVKLLGKIWEYELQLYGKKKTKITDEEYSLATLLGREFLEKQDRIG